MGLNILLAALAGLLVVVGIVSKVTNKYPVFSIQLFFLLKFLPPTSGGTLSPSRRHGKPRAMRGAFVFPGKRRALLFRRRCAIVSANKK